MARQPPTLGRGSGRADEQAAGTNVEYCDNVAGPKFLLYDVFLINCTNIFFINFSRTKKPNLTEKLKIERILKLIRLLIGKPYTIKQLSTVLDKSDKTIYKDIDLLKGIDYVVEKDDKNRYFITLPRNPREELNESERQFLINFLQILTNKFVEAGTIIKKLKLDTLTPSAEYVKHIKAIDFFITTKLAIENKQWLVFKNYHSANSGTVKDRIVFPIKILNNTQIAAYEKSSNSLKHYKIYRIQDMEFSKNQYDPPIHSGLLDIDLFGMSGSKDILVEINLTELAKNLLVEEYPDAIDLCNSNNHKKFKHQLTLNVKSFYGIGRFILGLPGEIEIQNPKELKDYIKEKYKLIL